MDLQSVCHSLDPLEREGRGGGWGKIVTFSSKIFKTRVRIHARAATYLGELILNVLLPQSGSKMLISA